MGLTIHYRLKSAVRTFDEAVSLVRSLRTRAVAMPFPHVGEVVEFRSPIRTEEFGHDDPLRIMACLAERFVQQGDDTYRTVSPSQLVAFATFPGNGSEPAMFGLGRYPAKLAVKSATGEPQLLDTGLREDEWSWSCFCKTQYASDPTYGGLANFLQCHRLVIEMLDHAQSLGLLDFVDDEGGYWDQRDADALTREVKRWNEAVAGVAGMLKDKLGLPMEAPILQYPDFEHLEARGRDEP